MVPPPPAAACEQCQYDDEATDTAFGRRRCGRRDGVVHVQGCNTEACSSPLASTFRLTLGPSEAVEQEGAFETILGDFDRGSPFRPRTTLPSRFGQSSR